MFNTIYVNAMFLSFTSNVSFKAYLAAIRESRMYGSISKPRGLQTGETTDQTLTVTVTANSID
ncbi:hypothetical protein TOT_040000862 [Theileria orientalis strain Shintoku]|uniref:Uncharacterized protein n=1 Tax=Theileria orientalis strain Shintoku TaxID=869250 RepID=J7MF76_THEOR|nr:hypothetical protein TOT_040000862 [Theileria orientalis strain Shintoku]BAM42494.1 hypothetical protein TOT_040000862 [Theileria orientalis strain Shintoku]|eukprot:XP_009692795.1 hypothetical protein TOT_040000862 [Theileria orientalis strain Shintoku]